MSRLHDNLDHRAAASCEWSFLRKTAWTALFLALVFWSLVTALV